MFVLVGLPIQGNGLISAPRSFYPFVRGRRFSSGVFFLSLMFCQIFSQRFQRDLNIVSSFLQAGARSREVHIRLIPFNSCAFPGLIPLFLPPFSPLPILSPFSAEAFFFCALPLSKWPARKLSSVVHILASYAACSYCISR